MFATKLEPKHYASVGHLMTNANRKRRSATCAAADARRGMLFGHQWLDFSFSRQIQEVAKGEPQGYLFTAKSAIPVADAVRGYYRALDRPVPYLGSIAANQYSARKYDVAGVGSPDFRRESARLKEELDGIQRICVVDQFVASGDTLRYGAAVLERAGVHEVSAIRGRWWHETEKVDIDQQGLTSVHAGLLYGIGIIAASDVQNTNSGVVAS